MTEGYFCTECDRNHKITSGIGERHIGFCSSSTSMRGKVGELYMAFKEAQTVTPEPKTDPLNPDTEVLAESGGSEHLEASADTPPIPPQDPFAEFLDKLDSTLEEHKSAIEAVSARLTGVEQTIGQMGANPKAADPLKGWMEGPLGPTIKEIMAEIPAVLKSFAGGGSSELAVAITEQIEVKERRRIEDRAKLVVDTIYGDQELLVRDREE